MFDKIPSLKDFIIYVVPGLMICFCFISLAHYNPHGGLPSLQDLSGNAGVIVISIMFAFVVGFICSQLQIRIFNSIIKRRHPLLRSINGSGLSAELKTKLVAAVLDTFSLQADTDLARLGNDSGTVELCINYVRAVGKQESVNYFERDSNMASFAVSIPVPLALFLTLILLQFHWPLAVFTSVLAVGMAGIVWLCCSVAVSFRKGWVCKILYQFYILSTQKQLFIYNAATGSDNQTNYGH